MLPELYIQRLEEDTWSYQSSCSLPRPRTKPEEVWLRLTPPQQARVWVRHWSNLVLSKDAERRVPLSVEDLLRMLYADLTSEEVEVLSTLWMSTRNNECNPTWERIVSSIVGSIRTREAIRFILTQCIAKNPAVRKGKLQYFLGKVCDASPQRFVQELEEKGWKELEKLLGALCYIPYPACASIYLGDMDFYTLDACGSWCTPASLDGLECELCSLEEEVRKRAYAVFGEERVDVRRWSQEYSLDAFKGYRERASENSAWRTEKFMRRSRAPYFSVWGYEKIARTMGVAMEQMRSFVDEDIVRTAAQYRLEADCVLRSGGVQLWAERSASPLWPIQISNYDSSGSPPSLLLIS